MENLVLNLGSYQLNLMVSREGAEPLVALKPVCDATGIDWKSQLARTKNNPQFRSGVITIPSAGGMQQMLCIPVCQIGMWLCTINTNRVKEDARPKLLAFQEHLQVVIHEHLSGRLTMEHLQRLEKIIFVLSQELKEVRAALRQQEALTAELTFKIIDLQEENQELRVDLQAKSVLDRTLVSNAGRQLAAQKAAKKLIN